MFKFRRRPLSTGLNSQCSLPRDSLVSNQDAFAILLSAYHPNINLLGISTTHGNSSVAHTTINAGSLLTAMGRPSIPVYRGAAEGLTRPAVHAPAIHGESGIEGTLLLPKPAVAPATDVPAVDAMARALLASPAGTAWLVATGSLTNIAQVFTKYPELAAHIKGLSIMGGAIGGGHTNAPMGKVDDKTRIGNWSFWAEFNILVDPEAAAFLFDNEILNKKIALLPLDVTHLVLASKEVQSSLLYGKAGGSGKGISTLRIMLVELLTFFANTYAEVFGITEGPPLHDPLAVAIILDGIAGAEIPFYDFKDGSTRKERFQVKIATDGTHEEAQAGTAKTGQTVATLLEEGREGVKIPRGLDVKRFWKVIEDCLEAADEVNKANGVF
ncbi:inosine-uridine preferring nucleoside hydrolase [Phlyctema vagabunda]|uniref:Inosine-uridine preferring nucleoside hydrolase n=1 Tax=Phlyctema vagabunda TaxID=108571 RepID=A0ABR4P7D4_9HELO